MPIAAMFLIKTQLNGDFACILIAIWRRVRCFDRLIHVDLVLKELLASKNIPLKSQMLPLRETPTF